MFTKKKNNQEITNFENIKVGDKFIVSPTYILLELQTGKSSVKDEIVYEIQVVRKLITKIIYQENE